MDRNNVKRRQVLDALGDLRQVGHDGDLSVSHVMTVTPNCIAPQTSVLDLVKLLHAKQFRHLLVTDGPDRLVGVISDRDVIRCFGPQEHPDHEVLARITAAEIMSDDLVTVGPGTLLSRAVAMMVDQGISCLPVLADDLLVGILTNTDLHLVLQVLLQTIRQSSPEESVGAAASNP
ncbi:MAG: CBS domain-containing protein [Candidatus Nealsonbacteria bacterium]|nr:CBS domain-containing protein [Candidatus Nealsonbacteria bacterium]